MSSEITVQRLTGFGRGKSEKFNTNQITLGTSASCHMRFDPTWDKTVSPEHALLTIQQDGWYLADKSKAGCWIDGRRVTNQKLTPGTTVELGQGGPRVRLDFEPQPAWEQPQPPRVFEEARAAAAAVAETATVYEAPPAAPPVYAQARERSRPSWLIPAFAGAAIVALILILWLAFGRKDTDQLLAAVARDYEDAVGVVVISGQKNHQPVSIPMATAWAAGEKVFISNSHVAEPVAKVLEAGNAAFIVLNKHPEKKFRIVEAVVHPRYGKSAFNIDGKAPAVPAYDVGLLYVDAPVPRRLKIAPDAELAKMGSGYRIAYLGFPMEDMAGDGVDFRNPVANMQSGILTSMTDYWLSKAPFSEAVLLSHNLGAAGGASGSPIFNPRGEVVGVLSAGNIIGQISAATGEFKRAPSAVMINFAQRIDILRDIYPEYPK